MIIMIPFFLLACWAAHNLGGGNALALVVIYQMFRFVEVGGMIQRMQHYYEENSRKNRTID